MSSLPKIDPAIGTRGQRIHALRRELESLSADVRNVAAKSRGVLSSLGRSEGCVLASVVRIMLRELNGETIALNPQ